MAALDEPLTAAALQAACEGKTHSLKGLDVAAVTADLAKLSPAEAAALAARMDALRPSLDVDALARSLLDHDQGAVHGWESVVLREWCYFDEYVVLLPC